MEDGAMVSPLADQAETRVVAPVPDAAPESEDAPGESPAVDAASEGPAAADTPQEDPPTEAPGADVVPEGSAVAPGADAAPEDAERVDDILNGFRDYVAQFYKISTAKTYQYSIVKLHRAHGSSLELMGTDENYKRYLEGFSECKKVTTLLAVSLKWFRKYWAERIAKVTDDAAVAAEAPLAAVASEAPDSAVAAEPPHAAVASEAPNAATATEAPDAAIEHEAPHAAVAPGAPVAAETSEEKQPFDAIADGFRDFLLRSVSSPSTAKIYHASMLKLRNVHGRSAATMGSSDAFCRLVEVSSENQKSRRQLSASLKWFRRYWAERGSTRISFNGGAQRGAVGTPDAGKLLSEVSKEASGASVAVDAASNDVWKEAATDTDNECFARIVESFGEYMVSTNASTSTAKFNIGLVAKLHRDHGRSATTMGSSNEYLQFVENLPENIKGRRSYSSALRWFRKYWSERGVQGTQRGEAQVPGQGCSVAIAHVQGDGGCQQRHFGGGFRRSLNDMSSSAEESSASKRARLTAELQERRARLLEEVRFIEQELLKTQQEAEDDMPADKGDVNPQTVGKKRDPSDANEGGPRVEAAVAVRKGGCVRVRLRSKRRLAQRPQPEVSVTAETIDAAKDVGEPEVQKAAEGGVIKRSQRNWVRRTVTCEEWIETTLALYKEAPPQRQEKVAACISAKRKEAYQNVKEEHYAAAMLDMLRNRFIAGRLESPITQAIKKLRWGPQLLQSWRAAAEEKKNEAQAQHLADGDLSGDEQRDAEMGDDVDAPSKHLGANAAGAEAEDQRSRTWAAMHTLQRIVERWPERKPSQRWSELSYGPLSEAKKQEHDDAMALKQIRLQFLQGALQPEAMAKLYGLSTAWASDMLLMWQAQLVERIDLLAAAFPERLPENLKDDRRDVARWLREYRGRCLGPSGLESYVVDELKAWLPWLTPLLEEWAAMHEKRTQRAERIDRCKERNQREAVKRVTAMDRLRALVAKYPEKPPVRRLYVSSIEERDEQADAVIFDRLAKLHFFGALLSEEIAELAREVLWLRTCLEEWEKVKAEGINPEETVLVKRIQDIGQRHALPPTQIIMHEQERWVLPREQRIRHSDACFLKDLKDRFINVGLSENAMAAMRAVPVWGAPRLEEWTVMKDLRAAQIFEKNHRRPSGVEKTSHHVAAASRRPLRDDDRLQISGKEPRNAKARQRVSKCNGKTVAEALATVRNGFARLTRSVIAADVASGVLVVNGKTNAAEEADLADPQTPSRASANRAAVGFPASGKKRLREESFRSFTGEIVRLGCAKQSKTKTMAPLEELLPSTIEHLTADELAHYEKQLKWSTKRAVDERKERLEKDSQSTTLLHVLNKPSAPEASASTPDSNKDAADVGDGQPTKATSQPPRTVSSFQELTAYERQQLSSEEVRHFERQGLISDGLEMSLQERRSRLLDYFWKESSGSGPTSQQAFMQNWKAKAAEKAKGNADAEKSSSAAP